jgi:3-oxoacyl-[acyl-carrier protein] reductase
MNELSGRIVLITGASAGAGPAIARRCATAGAWIGVNYRRDLIGAKALVDDIRSAGGRAMLLPGDIADPAGAWSVVERLDLQWGPADIVVEASGAESRAGITVWPPVTNAEGALEITRWTLPGLRQNPEGLIVLIGPAATSFEESVRNVRAFAPDIVIKPLVVPAACSPSTTAELAFSLIVGPTQRLRQASAGGRHAQ